jgi:oxaloacetate decarboxylase alpha subunit
VADGIPLGAIAGIAVNYRVTVAGRSFDIEVEHERLVRVNGHSLYLDLEQVGGLPLYSLELDDEGYLVFVEEGQGEYQVAVQGQNYPVRVEELCPRLATNRVECSGDGQECLAISAPLAGNLVSLLASAGDWVEDGQAVAIVESMKMQMELKAPRSGMVKAVHGMPGRTVDQDEVLIVLQLP